MLELSWSETLLRLAVAALLGAVIGLERELDEKAAGLRTHILDLRSHERGMRTGLVTALGISGLGSYISWRVISVGRHGDMQIGPHFLGRKLILDEQLARHMQHANIAQAHASQLDLVSVLIAQHPPELIRRRKRSCVAELQLGLQLRFIQIRRHRQGLRDTLEVASEGDGRPKLTQSPSPCESSSDH